MYISTDVLKDLHHRMVRIRLFEQAAGRLFENSEMPGFLHLYVGEEAVAAGVCAALRTDDQIGSTHRGHGHLVAKGGDLSKMMAELMGKADGYCKGKGGSMHICDLELNMLGANGIVGAGVTDRGRARRSPTSTAATTPSRSRSSAMARRTSAPSTRPRTWRPH